MSFLHPDYIHPSSSDDLPYSLDHLDALMDAAGIDVLLATSKHSVRYLLGGYQFIFFSAMDAIGHSRYLPVLVYVKGQPDGAAFIGNKMEGGEGQNHPFWVPRFEPATWNATEPVDLAAAHLKERGISPERIGIEPSFIPIDAYQSLQTAFPAADLRNATGVLERLRAVKSPTELKLLKLATEKISASIVATVQATQEGWSKFEVIEKIKAEELSRGLMFDYCLLTLGASHNRAASSQTWQTGEVLSIDSGGNYTGYIGDICRMGFLGEPDAEAKDLLAQVESVQQAAFAKIAPGTRGGDVIDAANAVKASIDGASYTDFYAHGMGIITHEVPFLVKNHPVTYEAEDADQPLQAGMVVSVETTMLHPTRGYIKLEDTVAVTETGFELFGADARGYTLGGQ
ncbi:MAG: Xaa-Pro peptidase family protein [Rhodobacter sp.]|nr:Xaa-Pro peptidase family protein [Rhodobacter sp.]MCY4169669.1 Xaa-Pro peptidase family protein [Rhodobacter sp.]